MTDEAAQTVSNAAAVGPVTGVLPLPMLDYIKWNHMAWEGGDGEVQPFDPEPGFWQTISEVGVPDSWRDPIREKRVEVVLKDGLKMVEVEMVPRVEELAEEATKRGVPVLAMPPLEPEGWQDMMETEPMPVLEPTQVLPVVGGPTPKATPRSVASAKKRAANRAASKDMGSNQG